MIKLDKDKKNIVIGVGVVVAVVLAWFVFSPDKTVEELVVHEKAEALVGKWKGANGTSLEVSKDDGEYVLKFILEDGPSATTGLGNESGVAFIRDAIPMILRVGNGVDTGIEEFFGKEDCVYVISGEGYCRD